MEISNHTILITGGASGIGLALAKRFLASGSEVIVVGRRDEKLSEVKDQHPGIHTRKYDLRLPVERRSLAAWATAEFPKLDILINNAGIQRRLSLLVEEDWDLTEEEIAINLGAPVHLAELFIPHLLKQPHPVIMNVTSGLAFVPMARVPIYCATKAALHSFTLSLRYQLAKTPIAVVELIPPSVNTDLGGPGLHTIGVPVDEFADVVMNKLNNGAQEISYGFSEKTSHASREELDNTFRRMNAST